MLYVRKLFTQDLRDGKQIAFPKEPSLTFFSFDYTNNASDRCINFTFRASFDQFKEFDGENISTRIYSSSSEARMDGEVKAFIRDSLNASVDDLLIFKNKGTKHIDFEFMFVPKDNPFYKGILTLTSGDNHSVIDIENNANSNQIDGSLQQIYYGAPGTGKSYKTDEVAAKYPNTVRTTFHPDSDYSTFVGAYKPTMKIENKYDLYDEKTVGLVYPEGPKEGNAITENKIEYKFVKQTFLKAYVQAWKLFKDAESLDAIAPQFLVIEEINRGNCAQIFGDLFQLLDRKNGFSEYPIEADEDIMKCLIEEDSEENPSFGINGLELSQEQRDAINCLFDKGGRKLGTAEKICQGKIIVLPCNLYIWATMNTSDQSLFPIDSAFKRRWDWKYMRIKDAKKGWRIKFAYNDAEDNENPIDIKWIDFLKAINKKIYDATKSEDKQLGYFFCKPTLTNNDESIEKEAKQKDGEPTIITAETFVGKVIFYLWQDVFKATSFKSGIFTIDGKRCSFHDFYLDEDADDASNPDNLNLNMVDKFIANVIKTEENA